MHHKKSAKKVEGKKKAPRLIKEVPPTFIYTKTTPQEPRD